MKLILTRHGETDWNARKIIQGSNDIPLNAIGTTQAQELAETLYRGPYHIEHIYTSKQLRARKTAEIVSDKLKVPYTVLDGLEEMNLGLWEGLGWKEVAERYPEQYQLWYDKRRYTKTPGGESYQDVLIRFLDALKKISRSSFQEVLAVTHSANLMTLFSYLNDTPFHEMVSRYKMQNTALAELDSRLLFDEK